VTDTPIIKYLDEHGRCCGRKPRVYKRARRTWCPRCHASHDIETGEQIACEFWIAKGDGFVPKYQQGERNPSCKPIHERTAHD